MAELPKRVRSIKDKIPTLTEKKLGDTVSRIPENATGEQASKQAEANAKNDRRD